MRIVRSLTSGLAANPAQADRLWLPGMLHVGTAVTTLPVFGPEACVAGLLLASLASFVVYLPLTALALNHGQPIAPEASVPALPRSAQATLLALWTVTAWIGAALAGTLTAL